MSFRMPTDLRATSRISASDRFPAPGISRSITNCGIALKPRTAMLPKLQGHCGGVQREEMRRKRVERGVQFSTSWQAATRLALRRSLSELMQQGLHGTIKENFR